MAMRLVLVFLVVGYVHSTVLPLSCRQIRSFVDGHNRRRLQLAKGEVEGQPPASQMKYMVWDEELAHKATAWAAKGVDGHNPDRNFGKYKSGENLYWVKSPDKHYEFDPEEAVKSWFDEHKNYDYGPIKPSDFQRPSDRQIGHYTQVAWADTEFLGCAIAKTYIDGYVKYNVVCNYSPGGNFNDETPYPTTGVPSGKLVCHLKDCNIPYGRQCS